jgi:hypothetical protein
MTIAPRRRAASIDGKALRINATWSSARLSEAVRNRMTDGESRFAQSQQSAEVGVGRHDDAGFERGALEDGVVRRRVHFVVENVYGVVPGGAESYGDPGRQRIVDEEVHA